MKRLFLVLILSLFLPALASAQVLCISNSVQVKKGGIALGREFAIDGLTLFANPSDGTYRSQDGGTTWIRVDRYGGYDVTTKEDGSTYFTVRKNGLLFSSALDIFSEFEGGRALTSSFI